MCIQLGGLPGLWHLFYGASMCANMCQSWRPKSLSFCRVSLLWFKVHRFDIRLTPQCLNGLPGSGLTVWFECPTPAPLHLSHLSRAGQERGARRQSERHSDGRDNCAQLCWPRGPSTLPFCLLQLRIKMEIGPRWREHGLCWCDLWKSACILLSLNPRIWWCGLYCLRLWICFLDPSPSSVPSHDDH